MQLKVAKQAFQGPAPSLLPVPAGAVLVSTTLHWPTAPTLGRHPDADIERNHMLLRLQLETSLPTSLNALYKLSACRGLAGC